MQYDICIIGSGAGAGPIAYQLSLNGAKVIVLEKGDHLKRDDFSKDEIAYSRRSIVTPNLNDEYHVIEEFKNNQWTSYTTRDVGWDFWNGNIVGGASNFMSGFFHRLKESDFKLKSTFGDIDNSNIEDWCIGYDEFSKYYDMVDKIIGITNDTQEHPISDYIDTKANEFGININKTLRAILSKNTGDRLACYYSNYCGSYGCSSGAKGSSREALLNPALKTGNLTILSNMFVKKLNNINNVISEAVVHNKTTKRDETIKAKIFVVANGSVESCRLLLNSMSVEYPNGLGNNNGQVGKNLLFSAGGIITGDIDEAILSKDKLFVDGLFINRDIKEWYKIENKKGGMVEILFEHANPIRKAISQKYDTNDKLVWGEKFYKKLAYKFLQTRQLTCEIFNDWVPHDDCFVSIDKNQQDKYGVNVAKIRIGSHIQNETIGNKLAEKTIDFLQYLGATNINSSISQYPPQNLQAGGCRFGNNPKTSVLDKNCKVWGIENLYVTDGSFMPTGGSVPYTYTIYANSFRVAEHLINRFRLIKQYE